MFLHPAVAACGVDFGEHLPEGHLLEVFHFDLFLLGHFEALVGVEGQLAALVEREGLLGGEPTCENDGEKEDGVYIYCFH